MSFYGWGVPLPKGEKGEKGDTGATGPAGDPATVSSSNTNFLTVATSGSNASLSPGVWINQNVSSTASPSFTGVTANAGVFNVAMQTPLVNVANGVNVSTLSSLSTANRSVVIPDASGTVILSGANASLNSISLATTGGTPSVLDYFEFFTVSTTYTGIWATPPVCTLTIERIGRKVTLSGTSGFTTANSSGQPTVSFTLPVRLRPPANRIFSIPVVNNGTTTNGAISVASSGTITFFLGINGGNFSNGTSGPAEWTVIYFV